MKYFYFLIVILSFKSFGQERNEYKFRIMTNEISALPLQIQNISTQELTETDAAGYFSMLIKPGDKLVLTENDFYTMEYFIKSTDLDESIVRIYPESKSTVLKEVEVSKISTKSLGIDSKAIIENTYNPNLNMDFKAMFLWLVRKMKKKQSVETFVLRKPYEMNPYVASLPRTIVTDYLKIPENQVEAFYYFMNDDYLIDTYIRQNDEPKWRMHLLEKSIEFLAESKDTDER
ncbi:MAG TPA: hypothetical protein VKY33_09345 [Flavobacterium sp.]|nr:hypothetical protein [Flavobacterium sp.]